MKTTTAKVNGIEVTFVVVEAGERWTQVLADMGIDREKVRELGPSRLTVLTFGDDPRASYADINEYANAHPQVEAIDGIRSMHVRCVVEIQSR
jgi:hypothetical protein